MVGGLLGSGPPPPVAAFFFLASPLPPSSCVLSRCSGGLRHRGSRSGACLSRNSGEAWRRSGCEVPLVGCGRGSLDLASDLDSGSRSVSFLCFLYLPFSAWVRRLAWLKALLGFSRRWHCGVSLRVLVFSAGVPC